MSESHAPERGTSAARSFERDRDASRKRPPLDAFTGREAVLQSFAVCGPRGGARTGSEPELLFRWPEDAKLPDRFLEFCFPSAEGPSAEAGTCTTAALRSVLFGNPNQKRDPFVFTLSGEKDKDNLYGLCLMRTEVAYLPTSFAPVLAEEAQAMAQAARESGQHPLVSRCYCLISHFPVLPLLHDMLLALMTEDSLLCAERYVKFIEDVSPAGSATAATPTGPVAPAAPAAPAAVVSPSPRPSFDFERPRLAAVLSAFTAPREVPSSSSSGSSGSQPPSQASSPLHVLFLPTPIPAQSPAAILQQPQPQQQHGQTRSPAAASSTSPEMMPNFAVTPSSQAPTPPLQQSLALPPATPLPVVSPALPPSPPVSTAVAAASVLREMLQKEQKSGGTSGRQEGAGEEAHEGKQQQESLTDSIKGTERLLSLLEYCSATIRTPAPGDTMHYRFPSSPQYRSWRCPTAPSSSECAAAIVSEWALLTLFERLSLENVLRVFSTLMCERSLLIVCDHAPTLTAVALSTTPLARPLLWQGLFISLLPHSLHDVLDAPVPYVIGTTGLDGPAPEGVIMLDVLKDQMQNYGGPLPPLPDGRVLFQRLRALHTQARTLALAAASQPRAPQSQQQRANLSHAIAEKFREYTEWLLAQVTTHFRQMLTKAQKAARAPGSTPQRVTQEALANSFSSSAQQQNRAFTKAFLMSQMFATYFHRHLDVMQPPATLAPRR
eukprot:m51a1_g1250 hypothetical protein (721) ;mRNA; f:19088-21723